MPPSAGGGPPLSTAVVESGAGPGRMPLSGCSAASGCGVACEAGFSGPPANRRAGRRLKGAQCPRPIKVETEAVPLRSTVVLPFVHDARDDRDQPVSPGALPAGNPPEVGGPAGVSSEPRFRRHGVQRRQLISRPSSTGNFTLS